MSEVYYVSGGEILPDSHGLQEWLGQHEINPAWLDEVHWLSMNAVPENDLPLTQAYWPIDGPTTHGLLHLLMGELLLGKKEMTLLIQPANGRYFGMILGSPAALGRRNLLPKARLTGLAASKKGDSTNIAAWLRSAMTANETDKPDLHFLYGSFSLTEIERQALKSVFPWLQHKLANNLIQGLTTLVEHDLSTGGNGIFLENSRRLATWVEKL